MNIWMAYNAWSSSYDHDRNLTRDLDQITTCEALATRKYKNILELGCGTGKNTQLFSDISDAVLALDFSEGMIQQAKQKLAATNVEFSQADLTKQWPTINSSHDLIACNLVLEHIEFLSPIFSEAFRSLEHGGRFYLSELHPFRQYQGGKARFERDGQVTEVPAFVHHVSEFLQAAAENNLSLESFNEYWHQDDHGKPPRLAVFVFKKP